MRASLAATLVSLCLGLPAFADPEPPPPPAPAPTFTHPPTTVASQPPAGEVNAEAQGPKKPGAGDFDAGGQVRFPNGPDEAGEFATFNWIAVDLAGRYFITDFLTVNMAAPLAVKKPDDLAGVDPRFIGGATLSLEAKLPRAPFVPKGFETEIGLVLTGGVMREGAMLLSKRDYPLFVGSFKPGLAVGPTVKIRLSSLFDFATTPLFVYQSGSAEALTAVLIPTSTILKLGDLVKLSADLGIFTGDDFSFGGSDGGRISAGGSLTVKVGPILLHAGAGVASLLTGGFYPTIGDSFYVDLDVKYVK